MRRNSIRRWRWPVPEKSLVIPWSEVGAPGSISSFLGASLAVDDGKGRICKSDALSMRAHALQLQTRCCRWDEGV